jgi:hypothetical protein
VFRHYLTGGRRANPAADTIECWDGPSSELGFAEAAGGPAEPAAPAAAAPAARTADQPAADDKPDAAARQSAAEGEEGHDDADDHDDDSDPLDALSGADEEDGEQEGQAPQPLTPREKALKQRARKLERSLKKLLPVGHALKETGLDVKSLLQRHTLLSNIEREAQRDPRIAAILLGHDPRDDSDPDTRRDDRRTTARRDSRPADDDDVEYPFDTKDGPGRFVADLDKRVRTGNRDVLDRLDKLERSISGRVERIEGNLTATQRATVEREWKGAAEAAATKLEPGVRELFLDSMHAAYEGALSGRHRRTPQQVIEHYLGKLKVSQGQKDRASAAARQRTAETNNNLPRRAAVSNGRPASPQSRRTPRLGEFNAQLSRRFGAG